MVNPLNNNITIFCLKSIQNFHKKTATLIRAAVIKCWHLPIFPGRFQPSIFGTNELNYRVRNGNGWTLIVINTNYSPASLSLTTFRYYHKFKEIASIFLIFFEKNTFLCTFYSFMNIRHRRLLISTFFSVLR